MSNLQPESKPDGLGTVPEQVLEQFAKQNQADFEIDFFDSILRNSPDFVDVLRCQGELLSRKGLHARALDVDRRLARLVPADPVVQYNLACSLSRNGLCDEALDVLRRALERGYDDFEYLELDGDLDLVRNDPRYRLLIQQFQPRPKRRARRSRKS